MNLKKEQDARACALKTSIGGQALMEGIMMRGPKKAALAVRNTKGEIVVEEFATKGVNRPAICRWPIIRGVFGYIDSMVMGYKCLMRSAEISGLEDIVEESPKKKKKREEKERKKQELENYLKETEATEDVTSKDPVEEKKDGANDGQESKEEKLPAWVMTVMMAVSMVLAIALAVGLFVYVPSKLFELIQPHVSFLNSENPAITSLWKSVFEGVLKILLLVGYMALVSLMKDIRRTFMYHGAEHKTIFCYEAGLELTVENVKKQGRFHPRCGTSFLILMLLVSIFVSFFIDPLSLLIANRVLPSLLRSAVKILMLPIIVGIGYELIKFAGRHDNWLTRFISAPGVALQHLTVFEPTDDMIECAIAAVKEVIPDDGSDKL